MPTESCSRVRGRAWSSLFRRVIQAIRLDYLSFTIRLSDILLSWAYPHWDDFLKSRDKASKLPMAFDELFKVGLRFAGKRRWELCAAAAPSREPVQPRRRGEVGVLGRLAPWLRCQNVAALDERSVRFQVSTCLGLMISAHARSDRGVATLNPPILSCRGSATRSAVGILRSFYRCRSPSSVARSHFAKSAAAS